MTSEYVFKYLENSNKKVKETLIEGFINNLIVEYIPLYAIEYCVLYPNVQKILMKLSENELAVLGKIIIYAERNKQDWVPLGAKYIHVLKNDKYKALSEDIRNRGISSSLISNFLFLISNSFNFYNIKKIEDIENLKEIRLSKLNKILKTNEPNIILLVKYGFSYDTAFNYYKRYGIDVMKMEDSLEKDFLLDIKRIIEGKGTEKILYDNLDFLNNVDSCLRNYFNKVYNDCLYKINDYEPIDYIKVGDDTIPIYDAGVDFTFSIYSYGMGFAKEKPDNYRDDWLKPEISVDYMCNSIINSLNMRTSIKHCVYGFDNFEDNDMALLGANDLGTGEIYNEVNVTSSYHHDKLIADVEFRLPNELISNTRFTNNEVYRKRRRIKNGKLEKIEPSYIVYFKTKDVIKDDNIWQESVMAARDFKIPIVIIDCEKCLKYNIEKIEKKMNDFESCYDDIQSIDDVIEMIYSLKSGYKVASDLIDKYLNIEKLYSYVWRIIHHLEEMAELTPRMAIEGINLFLSKLDEEYTKVLKSPYWVLYARKQGYIVDKPNDVIELLVNLREKIKLKLNSKILN